VAKQLTHEYSVGRLSAGIMAQHRSKLRELMSALGQNRTSASTKLSGRAVTNPLQCLQHILWPAVPLDENRFHGFSALHV
jgi:hypothetical protein